jgi:hypothetical protein
MVKLLGLVSSQKKSKNNTLVLFSLAVCVVDVSQPWLVFEDRVLLGPLEDLLKSK